MLYLLTGREGTGKTHTAHRLLADWVQTRHKQAVLLVPRQFTFESDKGVLDAMGPKDACEVEVLSFSRLADVVFKQCGAPVKPLLKDGANAVMLARALQAVQDELHFFARHRANAGFVQKMLGEIQLFKQNKLTPDTLDEAAAAMPNGYLQDKLRETALIYRAYDALVAQSFFDDGDVLSAVCDRLRKTPLFRDKLVVIDDFSAFSAQEYDLIRQMLLQADDVYVTLCLDTSENNNAASPFALTAATARHLRRLCAETGVPFGGEIHLDAETCGYEIYANEALRALEARLFAPAAQAFSEETDAVCLCSAPGVREECDMAAMEIRRLLRTGKYRCRDIAVVFRSEEPYAKAMRYSLKKCGVPVFEDLRAPIDNEPLVIYVRALLQMCCSGFTTENLMRCLKTGLTPFAWDEIAEVENYALLWDLTAAGWQKPWLDNPDGFGVEMTDARRETLERLNGLRGQIMEPLLQLREEMKDQSGKQRVAVLYRFLRAQGTDEALKAYALQLEGQGKLTLALEQGQVWDLLMDAFNQLAQTLGDTRLPMEQFLSLFDLVVGAQSLGKLPDGFDEVYLCDAARIGTQMPRVIFALGMNSGVFPAQPAAGRLLSKHECDRLRTVLPQLPDDAAAQSATERFYVYNTLCSAREKLYVSCARTGPGGEKRMESEVLLQLRRLFPNCRTRDYDTLPAADFMEGSQTAFEWLARHWHDNTGEKAAFLKYFSNDSTYGSKLRALERAAGRETFRIKDKDLAKALFGRNLHLSASQLEKYESCPFQYFCRYGLRAKPRQTAKLDPAAAGTVVHYVLEKLLSEQRGHGQGVPDTEIIKARIGAILKEYMDTYMGGTAGKSARFLYLYRRMLKILIALVERLLFEFNQSSFVPVGFEVPIGPGKAVEPFRVELEDGYVELHGVIDRVDEMQTDTKRYIRVVDYKTGVKAFALSDVLQGLSMQMLLYLVSIWRSESGYYQNITPAGVLYMPARFEPYDADRGDTDDDKKNRRIAAGKMEGMILDDGVVLKGMDHSLQGALLPMTVNKRTNAISGRFISLTQLGLLAKRMDRILKQMGDDLHNGNVEAKPAFGKDHGRTCEWCDYRSVCQRENGGAFRYVEKYSHSEALTRLEEEEQGDGTQLDAATTAGN